MRKLIHALPKPILFGVLGALGCLLGWAAGEPLLQRIKPPARAGGEAPPAAAPVLVFNNEMQKRLQREEAKTGDVQISLMWDNTDDLDLHCVDPRGEQIFYGFKRALSGGELDVDMNARPPFSSQPVENIYWPPAGAPEGNYRVLVHHYSRRGGAATTPYTVGIKRGGQVQEFRGTIALGKTNLVLSFTVKKEPPRPLAQLDQRPAVSLRTTLFIGAWTSLLAVFMSCLLVVGQNFLLRRKLLGPRDSALVLVGGLAAGLISGGVSQHLFALAAQGLGDQMTGTEQLLPIVVKAGQVVGWALLGGLLGFGMGFFIPNLPKLRAAFAGGLGGALGAVAFLIALQKSGDVTARLVGATTLGFTIGLVVALVERLAREAALIVHWHEHERSVINLGEKPVILGSSNEAHLYLPKHKGFPPVTAIVTFREGRVQMDNKLTNSTHTLQGGNKLQIGDVWIEIQTDAQRK